MVLLNIVQIVLLIIKHGYGKWPVFWGDDLWFVTYNDLPSLNGDFREVELPFRVFGKISSVHKSVFDHVSPHIISPWNPSLDPPCEIFVKSPNVFTSSLSSVYIPWTNPNNNGWLLGETRFPNFYPHAMSSLSHDIPISNLQNPTETWHVLPRRALQLRATGFQGQVQRDATGLFEVRD